jgi:hypothetical protein
MGDNASLQRSSGSDECGNEEACSGNVLYELHVFPFLMCFGGAKIFNSRRNKWQGVFHVVFGRVRSLSGQQNEAANLFNEPATAVNGKLTTFRNNGERIGRCNQFLPALNAGAPAV